MHCPSCGDEFRSGFTRCASCDVELVESLDGGAAPDPEPSSRRAEPAVAMVAPGTLVDFCGFVSVDDARDGRDRLRDERIPCEIAIRESPESTATHVVEEYWLRVDRNRVGDVVRLIGEPPPAEGADETFLCGACGAEVDVDATVCPRCGTGLEDEG